MALAVLALAGTFISLYLYLFKIGKIGSMACGTGGCQTVQLSPQSRFLGIEVALIGLLGYILLLALAAVSLQPRFEGRSWPLAGLLLATTGAFGFTLYLKYLEFFVIGAVCQWCVASAIIIAIMFLVTIIEWRRSVEPEPIQ